MSSCVFQTNKWGLIVALICVFCLIVRCKSDDVAENDTLSQKRIDAFHENFKWGFIDRAGTEVIPCNFQDAQDFSQGLAAAKRKGRWGYINHSGDWEIKAKYKRVNPFSDGLAVVYTTKDKVLVIDLSGEIVFRADYQEISPFTDGVAIGRIQEAYFLIDRKGQRIIDEPFEHISKPVDGQIRVRQRGLEGVLTTSGSWLIKPTWKKVHPFFEGMARFLNKTGWGYLDRNGKIALAGPYDMAGNFHNGRAVVADAQGFYLIDSKGIKQSENYEYMIYANENRWIANNAEGSSMIDDRGAVLTEKKFHQLYKYSEGIAGCMIDDLWGFIDRSGQEVIPLSYVLVWPMTNGKARLAGNGHYYIWDKDTGLMGQMGAYTEVRAYSEGFARVQVFEQ